jgi:D-alanine-D-alanine ligase
MNSSSESTRPLREKAPERLRVVVLMGGPDAEHEVSLRSGAQVLLALQASGLEATSLVVDRPEVEALRGLDADVVFPVLHGPFGEGGPLQERLEAAGVAFVGCGSSASRLGMDKLACKRIVSAVGVPTPEAEPLVPGMPTRIEPPAVIKPIDDGSSVGVRLCDSPRDVAEARQELEPRFERLMIERRIRGREITVGLLDGHPLPIIEIVPAKGFYDFEAKYLRDDTRYLVDPPIEPRFADACRLHAVAAWNAIGCRDLARVDFLLDHDGPWFLEINTMPGMTDHSLLPKAAAKAGCSMPVLCRSLVERAWSRGARTAAATIEA